MSHRSYDHRTPLDPCLAELADIAAQVPVDHRAAPACIHPVLRAAATAVVQTAPDGMDAVRRHLPVLVATASDRPAIAVYAAIRAAVHVADAISTPMASQWRTIADLVASGDFSMSLWRVHSSTLQQSIFRGADHIGAGSEGGGSLIRGFTHAFAAVDPEAGLSYPERVERASWAAYYLAHASVPRVACSPESLLAYTATETALLLADVRTVTADGMDADAWQVSHTTTRTPCAPGTVTA